MDTKNLNGEWQEVAADISALALIQIWGDRGGLAELEASVDAPTGYGKLFSVGDTLITARIPDIGAAGKLWGRSLDNVIVAYE